MFAFKTIIFLIFLFIINCENAKVSPKLDFTESNDENNSDEEKIKSTIQGVRVVVDTSKFKKSIELKSDEDDNDASNNSTHKGGRKTVGIRTDITFEINDDQNDSNSTSKEKTHKHNTNNNEDVDDNDASIPIFRGTNTRHSNTNNNNNNNNNFNYNDNTNNQNWNINNNRRYDNNKDNHNYNINIDNLNDHSIDIDSGEPVFHRIDDENVRHGSIDNWSNFIPINGIWTTEKYSSNIFQHNQQGNQHNQFTPIKQKTWQPCYCETSSNGVVIKSYKTSPQTRRTIDDKLDGPFSNSDK